MDSAEANQAPNDEITGVQNFLNAVRSSVIDVNKVEMKMHRFPLSLGSIDGQYIQPMVVAIGPYYHGLDRLEEMENVKHVMARNFIRRLGRSAEELYAAVHSVAGDACILYAEKAMEDISEDAFAAMMSHDACFLREYRCMLYYKEQHGGEYEFADYSDYFNDALIALINNDIMLLENQLPWLVIEKLGDIGEFGFLSESETSALNAGCRPPHLLGLFLSSVSSRMPLAPPPDDGAMQVSVPSAIELAEIGINLTASNTTGFMEMGFKEGNFFSEIFLAPLNLDVLMASRLVNMAAFQVSMATTSRFRERKTDVCSYLRLLAMLMAREEDVHELRKKGLVQGALTNQQTLNFFKGLTEHMYDSPRYAKILREIQDYKSKRWMWIKLHKFLYNNYKTIASVLSIIGVVVTIFTKLFSLKQHG